MNEPPPLYVFRPKPTGDQSLQALVLRVLDEADGPLTNGTIRTRVELLADDPHRFPGGAHVGTALSILGSDGRAVNVRRGVWKAAP